MRPSKHRGVYGTRERVTFARPSKPVGLRVPIFCKTKNATAGVSDHVSPNFSLGVKDSAPFFLKERGYGFEPGPPDWQSEIIPLSKGVLFSKGLFLFKEKKPLEIGRAHV